MIRKEFHKMEQWQVMGYRRMRVRTTHEARSWDESGK